jgi:selenocysteine lyase/cysteine desulfurase
VTFDVAAIRAQFPITAQRFRVEGKAEPQPVIYLDHAASTHPPTSVLDTLREFLEHSYANVHRGRHFLSQIASEHFDHVSDEVRTFIHGEKDGNAVVLCGNTTQALDLAAHVMAIVPGPTLVTLLEHHSNDLPHRRRGPVVHTRVTDDGCLDDADLVAALERERPKLVAVTGASNVTGYRPALHEIARLAHAHGALVLVDAAQLLAHAPLDVRPNGDPGHLDFVAAAGHKAYAPFGSAFLFGPTERMDAAAPYLPGGGTVWYVTEDDVLFKKSPERHESGTPNIAGAVAMAAALRLLRSIGMDAVREHERVLTGRALIGLQAIEGVSVLGHPDPERRIGVIAFTMANVRHERVATILNQEAAIAVRNGCFCAQPYLYRLLGIRDTAALRERLRAGDDSNLPGAVRPSFGLFNTEAEVDTLLAVVRDIAGGRFEGRYTETEGGSACKEL